MTEITFNIYYEFNGPTKDKQLIERKNKENIIESFNRIEEELSVIIDDPNAAITIKKSPSVKKEESNTGELSVVSYLSEENIAHAVKRTLDGLGLYYNLP